MTDMTSNINKYLSTEQQTTIQAAVMMAESRTSGEIVPMLVAQSDDYRETAIQTAAIMALALALAISLALQDTSVWFFLPIALALYFPLLALVHRLPLLKLALTPATQINETVRMRAIRAFHERGLHRTREENGILIFISLLERKVWILGGRGINAVIPAERWTTLAFGLTAGIREGRMTEALVATIGDIGGTLCQHFPRNTDDTNELPDLLGD